MLKHDKAETGHRNIPLHPIHNRRTADQDMAAGVAQYGAEWITPASLRAAYEANDMGGWVAPAVMCKRCGEYVSGVPCGCRDPQCPTVEIEDAINDMENGQ